MARIAHKDIGDVWEPQAIFTVAGSPTDPTQVTAKYKDSAGAITTLGPVAGGTGGGGITRVSVGVFKIAVTLDAAGYWKARFEGTGAAAAAEDHEIVVDPSEFDNDAGIDSRALVALAETKDWLQSQQVDTGEDLELVRVINDISDRFHREARREFKAIGTNPQTRTIIVPQLPSPEPWYVDGDYMGDRSLYNRVVSVGDMSAVTTVKLLDRDWTTVLETVAASDMTFHREEDEPTGPITDIEFHPDVTSLWPGMRVEVTGSWGFPSVPGNVRQAVLDAVLETMDRDPEHWRQDMAPTASGEAANVIVIGSRNSRPISLPPRSLAVARSYRTIAPVA